MCVYHIFIILRIQRDNQIDEPVYGRWCCISYTATQMWPCYAPFSTYGPTRSWGVGSLSAQNVYLFLLLYHA